jgi:hypothetical protein
MGHSFGYYGHVPIYSKGPNPHEYDGNLMHGAATVDWSGKTVTTRQVLDIIDNYYKGDINKGRQKIN